jgi:hypothetical protein
MRRRKDGEEERNGGSRKERNTCGSFNKLSTQTSEPPETCGQNLSGSPSTPKDLKNLHPLEFPSKLPPHILALFARVPSISFIHSSKLAKAWRGPWQYLETCQQVTHASLAACPASFFVSSSKFRYIWAIVAEQGFHRTKMEALAGRKGVEQVLGMGWSGVPGGHLKATCREKVKREVEFWGKWWVLSGNPGARKN